MWRSAGRRGKADELKWRDSGNVIKRVTAMRLLGNKSNVQ